MTTIYLIRHAEAEGNRFRRIHGQYDSLITARGWKQIEALSKRFENVHIDAVYSSDLMRTRMTASAIYQTHALPLHATPTLREVAMGVWEDKPWGEVELYEPEQLHYFSYDPEKWTTEGCEAIADLTSRIRSAVTDIAARHDGQTVAVVTHGCAIRALISSSRGIPPECIVETPHCDNTAVALLRVCGDRIDIEYDGDNSHLPEELSTFQRQQWWKDVSARDCNNLYYRPFKPECDMSLYLRYRELAGYSADESDARRVRELCAADARAVYVAMLERREVGLLELDPERDADKKLGWIEFYYVEDECRGRGMSIQLIGQAVSVYRAMSRSDLRIAVPADNAHAAGFFRGAGFHDVESGEAGSILGMKISLEFK